MNMTDKELLELAAKAAGKKNDDSQYNGGGLGNDGFDLMGNLMLDWHNCIRWNPLTDYGYALRLAMNKQEIDRKRSAAIDYLNSRNINRAKVSCRHKYTPAEKTDVSKTMKGFKRG